MDFVEDVNKKNVVARLVHLPLVGSTCDMVSDLYSSTKSNHPYLKSVCEVAENSVKSITVAAFHSALPIFGKLEPQISRANDLACKGLDQMENTLPVLHKPPQQIFANTKEAVTGATEAVSDRVNSAKESISLALKEVMGITCWAVQDGMERTKTVFVGGVQTVMKSSMGKLMASSVDAALSSSKTLLKPYIMEIQEKTEHERNHVETLPSKVRSYQRAVEKVRQATKNGHHSASLHNNSKDWSFDEKLQEKTSSLVAWTRQKEDNTESPSKVYEWHSLSMALSLGHQLQSRCVLMASSLTALPQQFRLHALEICIFNKASVLADPSSSFSQLSTMRDFMDDFMEYLLNNTPLNWLVGPFYLRVEHATAYDSKRILQLTG